MLAMILSPLHNKSRLEKANANIFSGKANLMIFASAVAFLMEIRVYFAIVLEILLRSHSVPRVSSSGAVAVITVFEEIKQSSRFSDVRCSNEMREEGRREQSKFRRKRISNLQNVIRRHL